LASCDVVIYDYLVNPEVLCAVPAASERIYVGKVGGGRQTAQHQINHLLIGHARTGKRVVRLKGGDPFLFGRGGEEAEALHAAGIAYEVVPGVTSGLAAAACAGIPLTHRLHASAVAFVTGHEHPGKAHSNLDWKTLAQFPGTLVVYMGIGRLQSIAGALMQHGKPADTPAAVIHWGATGEQQTVEAPLGELAGAVRAAGLTAPAIIVIGYVAALRPKLAWFERRPLFGKRILVTRPRRQAGDMVHRLEALGAIPQVLPAVEVQEPADWAPVDRALAELSRYNWIVFTSANGVHAFLRRLRQQ